MSTYPHVHISIQSLIAYRDRDYRYKRSEYAARGILEYWIVDPEFERVTILTLIDGLYEETIFENEQKITSNVIAQFSLIAARLFDDKV